MSICSLYLPSGTYLQWMSLLTPINVCAWYIYGRYISVFFVWSMYLYYTDFSLFVRTDNLHQNCGCTLLLLVKSSRWAQDLWLLVMLLRKIGHLSELHILVPVERNKKYINTFFLISELVHNFYYPNFLLRKNYISLRCIYVYMCTVYMDAYKIAKSKKIMSL